MTRKTNDQVHTIDGLQGLLIEAVGAMRGIDKRDLPWARTMISAVNSGNSLLRTKMKQDDSRPARKSRSK